MICESSKLNEFIRMEHAETMRLSLSSEDSGLHPTGVDPTTRGHSSFTCRGQQWVATDRIK